MIAQQNDFSLGELSPRTYGRSDQPWFVMGCRKMENFIALSQGAAEARPGTIFEYQLGDETWRLFKIVPIHGISKLISFSSTMMFIFNIDSVTGELSPVMTTDDDEPVVIMLNIPDDILFEVYVEQFKGNVYFTHHKMVPFILNLGDGENALPSMEGFIPSYVTIVSGATYNTGETGVVGQIVYQATEDGVTTAPSESIESLFEAKGTSKYFHLMSGAIGVFSGDSSDYSPGEGCVHNGKLWVLGQSVYRYKSDKYVKYIPTPDPYDDPFATTPQWRRKWRRKDYGYTVAHYYPMALAPSSDPVVKNKDLDDDRPEGYGTLAGDSDKVILTGPNDPTKPTLPTETKRYEWILVATLDQGEDTIYEYSSSVAYKTGDFVYGGNKYYEARIDIDAGTALDATGLIKWKEIGKAPSFNDPGEYPNKITFHQGRLYVLGTSNDPNLIIASSTENELDFLPTPLDPSGAVQVRLGSRTNSLVTWSISRDDLLLGTEEEEWKITGNGYPITSATIGAYPQSRTGGMRNGALDVADALMFFQSGGQRLVQFIFSNDSQSYRTPDVGFLGEHMLRSGVKQFALQTNPDYILWCVMNDGTLVGGTYNSMNNTIGWHKHVTDGTFESVSVDTEGSQEDVIYAVVLRDGLRRIERFALRNQEFGKEMVYVDDAEILTVTDGKATVSDLKKGMTLTVLYGGSAHQDVIADAETGEIELNFSSNEADFDTVVVGRPYYPILVPQKIIPGDTNLDSAHRITRVGVLFLDTLGVSVGAGGNLDPVQFRDTAGKMGVPLDPYSGEATETIDHSSWDEKWLNIKRDQPFPCTILKITLKLEVGGI